MSEMEEPAIPIVAESEPFSSSPALPSPDSLQPTSPKVFAEPVASQERFATVDLLRGFALLGILAMNIVAFAWPGAAYGNPLRGAGFTGMDRVIWVFNYLFFEMKMMTLFSMLFGAGLILMAERSQERGASITGVYYRRCLWLLAIGAIHAYLIWFGDILVDYAECGLIIYLFRRWYSWALILVGFLFLCTFVPLILGFAAAFDYLESTAEKARAAEAANEQPTRFQSWIYHDVWIPKIKPKLNPEGEKQKEKFEEQITIHRGGYFGIVANRAKSLIWAQTLGFLMGGFFMSGGRMLIGMGLMKLGVFSGERSTRFYWILMLLGYGIGFPMVGFEAYKLINTDFNFRFQIHGGIFLNAFGSVIVALGHVGALILIHRAGIIPWLTSRIAAAGQMALTNYLSQSLICTTLFYGYGFGLFGYLNRTALAGVVLGIWIFQLLISKPWLQTFRFGPAEWLWRSLTYWKLQPFLKNQSH